MTDITELAQSLKAAAEKASNGDWVKESGDGWEACCSANDQANGGFIIAHFVGPDAAENREFVQAANPANVLALVEALEKAQRANRHLREQSAEWERKAISNFEECAKLSQRVEELESRAVKPPDELSGEVLLDNDSDVVYSDDAGVLEYTNINGCFVKITAPPDKVIRFRCRNEGTYIRLVDRVKIHEHAGIIIDIPKNYKDFIQ
ncbi:ead/Ea22-like family protein [Klebsiella pneumoniae]|uniref:ead/Ea22-like family protein n=1 Tax=Klebsiella pneumoniae TaxID=573 RepID=UPI003D16D8E8